MKKKRIMESLLALFLLVLSVLCVAAPFAALFTGNGTYSWQFWQESRLSDGEAQLLSV